MYWLYSVLYGLALIVSLPYWLFAMLRSGKYRAGLKERFGSIARRISLPAAGQRSVWIHAVSVGEVLAVSGLITALQARLSEIRIFISTTTQTGQALARQRFGEHNVFYMPLDLPFAVNAVLRTIRPEMLVLAETEFWPNVLRLTKGRGASIAVVNGRISDRSLPGYRRFRGLLRQVLESVDLFLAQSEIDAKRLVEIGAMPDRVHVSGNLKFDAKIAQDSPLSSALKNALTPNQQVLVFGSTVEGEESLLNPCFKSVLHEFPQALIVLAPRHPERFDAVAELLRSDGISFWRRTAWSGKPISGGVLLLDTIGELASVYSLAQFAFVGGSMVPRGGHNILEPAHFSKAILIGPHYENFRVVVDEFIANNAIKVVPLEQMTTVALQLMRSPEEAALLGQRAKSIVVTGQGSVQRTLSALLDLLEHGQKPAPGVSQA